MNGDTDQNRPANPPGRFATGGLIRAAGPAGDDRVWPPLSRCSAGRLLIGPISGSGPYRELGTMQSDGVLWPEDPAGWLDGLVSHRFEAAVTSIITDMPVPSIPVLTAEDVRQQMRRWTELVRAASPVAPTRAEVGILERIDRAVGQLCPCGAAPREGSAYCSYDCVPNHVTPETEPQYHDVPPTAMRWRPDLVSAVDDTGLVSWIPRTRHGDFCVEVFVRAGTDQLHVRLDDGARWVGADVARDPTADFSTRYEAKLRALLAELDNERHRVLVRPTQ